MFSWRRRKIINSLICTKDLFVSLMEERLTKYPEYKTEDHCSEPGRYDKHLGVTRARTEEYYCAYPIVVFSHPDALGYVSGGRQGPNKELGPVRGTELVGMGTVHDVMKLYDKDYNPKKCETCGKYE